MQTLNYNLKREIGAILTISYRDFTKLMRDKFRLLAGLIFPFLFIGILGTSLNSSIGGSLDFNFLAFIFIGVFAQSLFQSSAAGVISLIQDRENDFSQELFVAPVSRYSIILGKIIGETLVSYTSGFGILLLGLIIGIDFTILQLIFVIIAGFIACLFGGAFGVLVLANLSSQRTVQQVFPFILFPQIFLSGVFNPIDNLPLPLMILSRIAPLTYVVDLMRHAYYGFMPPARAVIFSLKTDIIIVSVLFSMFLVVGTLLFVRREKNR